MTDDEFMEKARALRNAVVICGFPACPPPDDHCSCLDIIATALRSAVADEREACARRVEYVAPGLAAAIRSRGQP